MANRIPVDVENIVILAMSGARPAPARATLSDGSSRVIPGEQAVDKAGVPQYQVDCVMPADADDETGRMNSFTVKVSSATRPAIQPGLPVRFVGLAILAYNDQQTGRATLSWSAGGVVPAAASARSSDRAA